MTRRALRRVLPPDRRDRVRGALARRFGVDARALAALRVALAALVLADLLVRSLDLVAFYTDAGVLPRAVLRQQYPAVSQLSVHTVSGAAWAQVVLFLLAGAVALALLVGYRTTAATALTWLLLVSLHARNPVVLNAGDSLLRRLLFWGLFLPLGGRWSVDALRREEVADRVATLATVALLSQVVVVYLVNAVFKLRGDRWLRGVAIRYVFELDRLTVRLGDTLAAFPALLEALGWVWLVLVVAAPLLVVLTGRTRTLLVAAFAVMHLGMALTLRLGLFPLVSVAALLPFLPGRVWDAVETHVPALSPDPTPLLTLPAGPAVLASVGRAARAARPPVVALLLVGLGVWNGMALGYVAPPGGEDPVLDPAEYRWDMFAPSPPRTDGRYVVPGDLESGERIDALQRESLTWDRPPDLARTYPSHRWYVYLYDLRRPGYGALRPHFADYLCARWNARHDDDLASVTVYYVEEPTRLDGPERTRRVELLTRTCPGHG